MEIIRAEMVSKRCKGNGVKFINLQSLRGIRNGIENGDIPEWLLIEVLIRQPTKAVHRFKIVSKQWLSVISDPSFIRDYVSRASSLSLSQPWTYISHHMLHEGSKSLYIPEYELLEDIYSQVTKPSYRVLPLPFTQQSNVGETYLTCGVSNGLVLYNSCDMSGQLLNYYICNPVTGQWIALPNFKWCIREEETCGFVTHVEDGLLKSYRVVRLMLTELFSRRMKSLRIDVFFSEIGKWKKFVVSKNLEILQCFQGVATAVNGVLYWIVRRLGIIAYNPDQNPEQVHTIAFPVDIVDPNLSARSGTLCAAYEGKLRYFEVCKSANQYRTFKLWVLNDHISGDWSLQHKIGLMDIQCDANLTFKIPSFTPLSFHPFNLDIVYFGCGDALVSYNMETKRLKVEEKCCRQNEKTPEEDPEWWWALLLVIPSWPTSLRCLKG